MLRAIDLLYLAWYRICRAWRPPARLEPPPVCLDAEEDVPP